MISDLPSLSFCSGRCSSKDKPSQSSIHPRFVLLSTISEYIFQKHYLQIRSKPLISIRHRPFQSLMSLIKPCASSFPLFAASEISDSARSAFCSIPRPNAQHLAIMSIASVSPRATQSSRSVTAFGWFCGTPFPSISFLACSLFSSTCFCVAETSSCALSCSWAVCLSVILFAVLFLHFFFREKVNQSPLFLRIELFHPFFRNCELLKAVCCFSQPILWASASEPAGSVPSTQSQKREVGTIALWPHARAC